MTLSKQPTYLFQRGNIWWFRQRIPNYPLLPAIRLSLQTTDIRKAREYAIRASNFLLTINIKDGRLWDSVAKQKNADHLRNCTDCCRPHRRPITSLVEAIQNTDNLINSEDSLMASCAQNLINHALKTFISNLKQDEIEHWLSAGEKTDEQLNDCRETYSHLADSYHVAAIRNQQSLAQSELSTFLSQHPETADLINESESAVIANKIVLAKRDIARFMMGYLINPTLDISNPAPLSPQADFKAPESLSTSPKLSVLIQQYEGECQQKGHSHATYKKYNYVLVLLLSYFGDCEVHTITADKGRRLRDIFASLPKGLTYKQMEVQPLEELISEYKDKPIVSKVTANDHMMKATRFFQWMVNLNFIPANPIPSESIPAPALSQRAQRTSIADAEADTIFAHTLFTEHQGVKTKKIQHPHHYWLPLLCAYAGMRPSEIFQLHANDIEKIGDIWCIRVDNRYENQGLKTPNAKRRIPIHQHLIQLGFIRYVTEMKAFTGNQNCRLFPAITIWANKHTDKPGEWFRKNLRDKLSLPEHVTLYAFRHAFKDKIAATEASDQNTLRLIGHADGPYGSELLSDMTTLNRIINKISYGTASLNIKPFSGLHDYHSIETLSHNTNI